MLKLIKIKTAPHLLGKSFRFEFQLPDTLGDIVGVAVFVPADERRVTVTDSVHSVSHITNYSRGVDSVMTFAKASVSTGDGEVVCPSIAVNVPTIDSRVKIQTLNQLLMPVSRVKPCNRIVVTLEEHEEPSVRDGIKSLYFYDAHLYIVTRKEAESC